MAEHHYHDRKMMKWMPFNALLEQGEQLSQLLSTKNQQEKPILSDDQLAELNYDLERAYMTQSTVTVVYFKSHQKHRVTGQIHQIDIQNKMIVVADKGLYAEDVLDIMIQ